LDPGISISQSVQRAVRAQNKPVLSVRLAVILSSMALIFFPHTLLAQVGPSPSPAERAAAQMKEQRDAARGAAEAAARAARAADEADAAAKAAVAAAAAAKKAQVEAERAAKDAAAADQAAGRASGGDARVAPPTAPAPAAPPVASRGPMTLQVGPDRPYKRPSEAAAAARNGDTVEIDAVVYSGDVAVWRANDLTLRGVGGRAQLKAAGNAAEGKAIWVIKGNNTVVENVEFSDCRVGDNNGAGIRQEGAGLTVRNSVFRDNDDGILTGSNADSDVTIESSEFAANGFGDGRSHNIYIGAIRSFTLRNSFVHHAKIGHNVKTRARTNLILYNRILDGADGTSSYAVDLSNGGTAILIGNVIEQGPQTDNSVIISYGAEGGPGGAALTMVGNTVVNDRPQGGIFITRKLPGPSALIDNIFVGPGSFQIEATTKANLFVATHAPEGNFSASDAGFVDRAKLDFRLKKGSPAIDKGVDPGETDGQSLRPAFEFVPPASARPRPKHGPLDIGAYEYDGG
jgi:hypothetical protein